MLFLALIAGLILVIALPSLFAGAVAVGWILIVAALIALVFQLFVFKRIWGKQDDFFDRRF